MFIDFLMFAFAIRRAATGFQASKQCKITVPQLLELIAES